MLLVDEHREHGAGRISRRTLSACPVEARSRRRRPRKPGGCFHVVSGLRGPCRATRPSRSVIHASPGGNAAAGRGTGARKAPRCALVVSACARLRAPCLRRRASSPTRSAKPPRDHPRQPSLVRSTVMIPPPDWMAASYRRPARCGAARRGARGAARPSPAPTRAPSGSACGVGAAGLRHVGAPAALAAHLRARRSSPARPPSRCAMRSAVTPAMRLTFSPSAAASTMAPRLQLVLQLVEGVAQRLRVRALELRGEHLHALHVHRAGGEVVALARGHLAP